VDVASKKMVFARVSAEVLKEAIFFVRKGEQDPIADRDYFLATMLSTDRPSVSLAAAGLQRKGAVAYQRGIVKNLNRRRLETAACECYAVIRQFDGELDLC
jgi:hypothetical protein